MEDHVDDRLLSRGKICFVSTAMKANRAEGRLIQWNKRHDKVINSQSQPALSARGRVPALVVDHFTAPPRKSHLRFNAIANKRSEGCLKFGTTFSIQCFVALIQHPAIQSGNDGEAILVCNVK